MQNGWGNVDVIESSISRECLLAIGRTTLDEFRLEYDALITSRLAKDATAREPQWTESIAVGSQAFVEAIGQTVRGRQRLDYAPIGENAWVLRDLSAIPKTLATQNAGENWA